MRILSATYIRAIVRAGATEGKITVTTPSGTLSSNKNLLVLPWRDLLKAGAAELAHRKPARRQYFKITSMAN
jgi:hypothetical protein